jgi:hypothetical protein
MSLLRKALICLVASSLTLATPLQAQESKGWDRTVRVADYLEPAI